MAQMAEAPRLEAWTLDAGGIRAWVSDATPGDVLVYAHMANLPPRSPAAAMVRALAGEQVVRLLPQKRGGDGRFDYAVERLGVPKVAARPARVRPVMDGDMREVLRLLRRVAREGRVCPTNPQIAARTGARSADRVRYALRRLAQAGYLRAEVCDRHDRDQARVVTFPDGLATARPAGAAR